MSQLCIHLDCKKQPTFNYENKKIPLYCAIHKLANMVDVKVKNVFMKFVINNQLLILKKKRK